MLYLKKIVKSILKRYFRLTNKELKQVKKSFYEAINKTNIRTF